MRMTSPISALLPALAIAVSAACGGSDAGDLFTARSGAADGGTAGSSSGGNSGLAAGGTDSGSETDGAAGATGSAGYDGGEATGGLGGDASCGQPIRYYADTDRDGYGDPNASLEACAIPVGYVTNALDCYDGNANAHPAQSAWFTVDRGDGSFDYDCNGIQEQQATTVGGCQALRLCTATQGWNQSVPGCGVQGEWILDCGFPLCGPVTELRVQQCR